jgi:AraC family transcriptional regulator of adaptative response/methylated-DNA-[protein]-cysteine methyltransferase
LSKSGIFRVFGTNLELIARNGVPEGSNLATLISGGEIRATMRSLEIKKEVKPTSADPRWPLVVARDVSADGGFFYAVKTTGIYCRPSCAARLARPENVSFFETSAAAEKAGFRPCKRCRPDQPGLPVQNARKVASICRLIDTSEEMPALAALARHAGMSVYHFHRTFKFVTGLTPRAYAVARRSQRLRGSLQRGRNVTAAIFEAGFNSSSRFYEKADKELGMKPLQFRNGGADTEITYAIAECSLGLVLAARSKKGVCAIFIGDDAAALVRDLQNQFPKATLIRKEPGYQEIVGKVVDLIESPAAGIDLPLDIRGTVFQQRVWTALRRIPLGTTASYAEIAEMIGAPKAVRAVAQACGSNSLAVAIPCHRVVRADGAVSGYRWGVERKRALLEREKRA